MILMIGALFGFFSIGFGAYAEHGLQHIITPETFHSVMTALKINQIHAVVLVSIGLTRLASEKCAASKPLLFSGIVIILGIFLFSFSIYASALLGQKDLIALAPWGGSTLMIGWLLLALSGFTMSRKTRL